MLACCCLARNSPEGAAYEPLPMHPASPAPALPAHELLAVDARSHRPVHLALTEHGLAVVKEKSGQSCTHALHASDPFSRSAALTSDPHFAEPANRNAPLAQARQRCRPVQPETRISAQLTRPARPASSSSTLVVPYLNLLAVLVSHRALPSPSASADAASHLSNISIAALVPRNKGDPKSPLKLWTLDGTVYEVGATDGHAQGGEGRKCAVDDWCKEAEDRAYAGALGRSLSRSRCPR